MEADAADDPFVQFAAWFEVRLLPGCNTRVLPLAL